MTSPREPVPSVGDAIVLLMKSASAQLRRSLRRSRVVAAPTAADAADKPHRVRRRISWRHALTVTAILVAIGSSAAAVAWWSWQTLQDRQVQLGGDRDLRTQRESRSLAKDLVQREERRLDVPVVKPKSGSASLDRPVAKQPSAGADPISIDGRIVAFALSGSVLLAAGGASWLVLRRYRGRTLLPAHLQGPRRDVDPVLEADPDPRPGADVADGDLPDDLPVEAAAELPQPDGQLEPAALDVLAVQDVEPQVVPPIVEQRAPAHDASRQPLLLAEAAATAPVPLLAADVATQPASTWSVDEDTVPAGAGISVGTAAPVDGTSYELTSDELARERIFDRRIARRVEYVQPAWLWWREQNAPVTVQDLSVTGLRLLNSTQPATAAGAPGLGDTVRVFFPVNGSTMKLAGRVQWKEQTSKGMSMGVEFEDLSSDETDLLRRVVAAVE